MARIQHKTHDQQQHQSHTPTAPVAVACTDSTPTLSEATGGTQLTVTLKTRGGRVVTMLPGQLLHTGASVSVTAAAGGGSPVPLEATSLCT